jgi:hypothetical protein
LAASFDGDTAFFVNICKASFGLQVGMFLHRCLIFTFHDHIGFGEGRVHITFADLVMDANICVAPVRVEDGRIGAQGNCRVGKKREVFIFHFDQFDSRFRFNLGAGYYDCDLIAHEADDIGVWLARARSAEYGLIWNLQSIFVDWYIFCSVDSDNPRGIFCFAGVNVQYTRMRTFGEKDLHKQHSVHFQVAGI